MIIKKQRPVVRATWHVAWLLLFATSCSNGNRALTQVRYDEGYVRFVDAPQNPRTMFHIRGEMTVVVYPGYIQVRKAGKDESYIIPRERLVYAGKEFK